MHKCPNCKKEFDRKDSLKRHTHDSCKGSILKESTCHKCSKEFPTNWHLKRHLYTCKLKCPHCKNKVETSLDDHVCNILQVRHPVWSKARVKADEDMDVEYPQNFEALVDLVLILNNDWDWDYYEDDFDIQLDIDRNYDSQVSLLFF